VVIVVGFINLSSLFKLLNVQSIFLVVMRFTLVKLSFCSSSTMYHLTY